MAKYTAQAVRNLPRNYLWFIISTLEQILRLVWKLSAKEQSDDAVITFCTVYLLARLSYIAKEKSQILEHRSNEYFLAGN